MKRLAPCVLLLLAACSDDTMSRIGAGLTGFSRGVGQPAPASWQQPASPGLLTNPRPVTLYESGGAVRSCHTVGNQIYC